MTDTQHSNHEPLRSDELEELANDILREMYAEAEPPLDFDEALANPDEMDDDWYEQHYLSSEECQRIFDKHTEGVDLTDGQHTSLTMTCLLDLAPSSVARSGSPQDSTEE